MALGVDLIRISRIEDLIRRKGLSFVQSMVASKASQPETLAGIFAAKEALSKALGVGLNRSILREAEVKKNHLGKPYIVFRHRVYDLSISHDGDYAIAFVSGDSHVLLEREMVEKLPPRDTKGNKKTFGRLAIVGGSSSMVGCMTLAAEAGLRTGAGYVHLYVPSEIKEILQIKTTEAIVHVLDDPTHLGNYEALAMGPGMERPIPKLMEEITERNRPVVMDADGLRWLKESTFFPKQLIVTPHHGEASRLLDVSEEEIGADPLSYAKKISKKFSCVCVLKGAPTYVVYLDRIYVNTTGNEGMGTAGSGDVLTGMIGAFLAGGASLWDAAVAGVYFHGLSADEMTRTIGRRSCKAGDIVEGLKILFREVEQWGKENEK
ncbi:MAG: NAD(P)H-hydrate dehydratase [Tissierellia bacterium]|nr:NAD(P)H-hydrate dehydratase [Tissierellia bacterium]